MGQWCSSRHRRQRGGAGQSAAVGSSPAPVPRQRGEVSSPLISIDLVTLCESPSRYTVSVPQLLSHCSLGQGRLWKGNTPGSRSRRFRCSCIARRQGRFEFILCKQATAATYVCVGGRGGGGGEGTWLHYLTEQGHILTHSHSHAACTAHQHLHQCTQLRHVLFKVVSPEHTLHTPHTIAVFRRGL